MKGRAGVLIVGTARDLGADSLWVFDRDPNDKRYYRDTDEPLNVTDGRWSFLNQPIGDSGSSDIGTTYTVAIVRATPGCDDKLREAKPNQDGDVVYSALPAGCVEAASVHVVKVST